LAVGVLGKTDTARISNAFKARGNVDAVAHQVAIALLDHVAQMDADAELDATLRRKTRVALSCHSASRLRSERHRRRF